MTCKMYRRRGKTKQTLKRINGGKKLLLQALKKNDLRKMTFEFLKKHTFLLDEDKENDEGKNDEIRVSMQSKSLSIINPEKLHTSKNELLNNLLNNIISIKMQSSCINQQFFSGTNNVVCKVKHSDSMYAVRISKHRFNQEEIEKTYLEEIKILVLLSKDQVTPYVYEIGLCCTKSEHKINKETFHVYSIMESFDMDLHDYFRLYISLSVPPMTLDKIMKDVNDIIEKFSKIGLNADMRATNILCNVNNNILKKLKCIDIDSSFFLKKGSLQEICSKISKFWDKEEVLHFSEQQERNVFSKAMEYIFWLEIYSSGLKLVPIKQYIKLKLVNDKTTRLFFSLLLISSKFSLGFLSAIQHVLKELGNNFFRSPSEIDDLLFMPKQQLHDYMRILKNYQNTDSIYVVVAKFLDKHYTS